REAADAGTDAERLAAAYETIEPVSIDHGVLEHSSRVWVMPCAFGWSDVGSWAALAPLLAHDASGNATRGEAVLVDAHDNLVVAEDRLVAAIGVEDLVIVATGGAVLVCPRNRAQDVREVVAELERRGRADLL
ncbi:MAG: mannose-1-phosphate guanylyltransferase, partial [Candidatus Eiseniibacteriota bacterium]